MLPDTQTERLCLRQLAPDDAAPIFAYRSLPKVSEYQSWPQSMEDLQEAICSMSLREFGTPGWYQIGIALLTDGRLIGDCGARFLETDSRVAEVAITIAPAFQSRGYASEALVALLNLLFLKQKIHRVYASVDPRNAASMGLMERIGLRKEAHFKQSLWFKGSWVDDVHFAILASEWSKLATG